ncbi:MAG: SDR family oxidoreductase, partial [Bacteroidota bacterium]
MTETIFLTGATGFLGTWIAAELLRTTDVRLVVLVRAENDAAAAARLRRAWWDRPDLTDCIGGRVQALAGDVSRSDLGMSQETRRELARMVTHVIHAAADLRLNGPLEEMRRTNVQGTENLLQLAHTAHRDHGLGRFVHVSTAYVAGNRRGEVQEEDLTDKYGFANNYERTKYEGESLVRAAMKDLPITILRPGMVVGDSRTGAIQTFNT